MVRFRCVDLPEQVEAFLSRWPDAIADRLGHTFVATGARLRVPLAALRVRPGEPLAAYAERLPGDPERQVIVLLQAGALALGYWSDGTLLQHKAVRRYVVRGHGKAQQKHLRTRGKSRYGSRLRLQNWRRLLVDANTRLAAFWRELGAPERVFVHVPVRARVDWFAADPPPPFAADDPRLERVPMHVHRPDFAELLRVRRWLEHGRLELPR